MVSPRSCSSGRRSGSMPVSALTRLLLPWSMCPAVPTTTGWMVRAMAGPLPVHVQDALAGAALADRAAAQQAGNVVGGDRRVAALADVAFDRRDGQTAAHLEQSLVLREQFARDALGQGGAAALDGGCRL